MSQNILRSSFFRKQLKPLVIGLLLFVFLIFFLIAIWINPIQGLVIAIIILLILSIPLTFYANKVRKREFEDQELYQDRLKQKGDNIEIARDKCVSCLNPINKDDKNCMNCGFKLIK